MRIDSIEQLKPRIHEALRAWRGPSNKSLQRALLMARRDKHKGSDPIRALILDAIDDLSDIDKSCADLLKLRFIEGATTKELAFEKHLSIDQINRNQRKALDTLCGILWAKEQEMRADLILKYKLASPLPGRVLIGREKESSALLDLFETESGAVAITGLGGLGKTTLAYELGWHLLLDESFDDVLWIKGASLNGQHNVAQKILSFISEDNSQTLGEVIKLIRDRMLLFILDDIQLNEAQWQKLTMLASICRPSRFLVTSRTRPITSLDILVYAVKELKKKYAIELFSELTHNAWSRETGDRIYHVAGGNPRALRYIANQLGVMPLEFVLERFSALDTVIFDAIFGRIWSELGQNTAKLIQVLSNRPEAEAGFSELENLTKMSAVEMEAAIKDATRLCLINVSSSVESRSYSVSRIAKTYQQIIAA